MSPCARAAGRADTDHFVGRNSQRVGAKRRPMTPRIAPTCRHKLAEYASLFRPTAWKLHREWKIPAEALIGPPPTRGRKSAA
jgi:hypothetical protein